MPSDNKRGPPRRTAPVQTQSIPYYYQLFGYEHVVCFDLLDPSCLQKSKYEGYDSQADSDQYDTDYRNVEAAFHKSEQMHEC